MYHNVKLDVIGELLRVDLGHWDSNNIQYTGFIFGSLWGACSFSD